MSIRYVDWALREAPTKDSTETLVLVGLANHVSDNGTGAYPSVNTLSKYAKCSERTIQRKLRDLEEAGVISRGDQRSVAHHRSDRRPVVYDINIKVKRDLGEPES